MKWVRDVVCYFSIDFHVFLIRACNAKKSKNRSLNFEVGGLIKEDS